MNNMFNAQDGISIAIQGLARIYHIQKQVASNDESILYLEQKLKNMIDCLATLRQSDAISFVSIDRITSEVRDYIKRYRSPSTVKWGMKMLRVDKISETIDTYDVRLNEAIELTLLQMQVNVHQLVINISEKQSQIHSEVKLVDKKTDVINDKLDVIINDAQVAQKSFFLHDMSETQDRTAQICERLKQWYLRPEASIIKLDVGDSMRELQVDELFINLEIIEQAKQQRKPNQRYHYNVGSKNSPYLQNTKNQLPLEQEGLHDPFSEQMHYKSTYHDKKEIKLDDLFSSSSIGDELSKVPRNILMLGRAGVGKTTLCLYQANRWAKGDLWQNEVRWMFHLELKKVANCRALENENKIHKILYEMIFRHFTDLFTEEQSESFWGMLLKRREPIVFLLDGYDEVSDCQHTACEALMAVIKNHPTASHLRILITSRPYARITGEMDIVLENIGFKDDNIPEYVEKYFNYFQEQDSDVSVSVSKPLTQWLSERSKIRQICRTPIHLELLCSVWQLYGAQLMKEDLVISDLYSLMIEKLIRRYLRKTLSEEKMSLSWDKVKLFPESQEILRFLKELAYQGLKAGNIIIRKDLFKSIVHAQGKDFQEKGIVQRFLSTGFLNAVGDNDEDPLTKDYYFIHLSFQEYLTADYFAQYIIENQSSKEIDLFITEHKYDPTYQLVWAYVGGLLRDNELAFKHYFSLLVKPPRDLFGMYELALLVRCAEEAKWPPYPILDVLLDYLGKWTINISQLEVEKHQHAVYFLNQLTALYLACPHAMLRVKYNRQEGLFNIMMHEARDQPYLDSGKATLDSLFHLADIGYYLAQSAKENLNEALEHQTSKFAAKILLTPFYGLLKAVSMVSYSVIFMAGNIPLMLVLNHYKNYKLKQASAIKFMTKFEFDDTQAVGRLFAQLKHPDTQVRLRLVRAIANVKFAPEVMPKVYLRLVRLFTNDPAYDVRQASYHQLLTLFPERITHNEPLWFFNFSLQYESLVNDIFYQPASLVEKLFSYYPDNLVKLGVDFVKQMRVHLIDYPQIKLKTHTADKHFGLTCLKLLKKDMNHKPIVLALVRETLLPIIIWQYADIKDESVKSDYLTNIVAVVSLLKSSVEATRFVWIMAREMQDKCVSRERFKDILYPLFLGLINNSQLKASIIESVESDLFSTWNCHDNMESFISFVHNDGQVFGENDYQLETGVLEGEIRAFDCPYVENKSTIVIANDNVYHNKAHTKNAVVRHSIELESRMDIDGIIYTLSHFVFVDPDKILHALSSINLDHISQKNKDELMVALLRCASKIRSHRYAYYYLPRIAFGHIILYSALSFVAVSVLCSLSNSDINATMMCASNFYVQWLNEQLPLWSVNIMLVYSTIFYASILTLNMSFSTTRNMLRKSYTNDWGGDISNKSIVQRFAYGTGLYDIFNLVTFNLLDASLYSLTGGLSSISRLQKCTIILNHIAKLIHEEEVFLSLLKAYPNYLSRQSQAVFYSVLRDKLALSTTAITREGFNHFTWYKSRTKITFQSAHPLRLTRDIQSVRLLSSYFGWLVTICRPHCWRQDNEVLSDQAIDNDESGLGLEFRDSFWNHFHHTKKSSKNRDADSQSIELVENPLSISVQTI
ncbi:MAG: hypothetical protein CK424_07155 [Legionella sp.]|nr:MAG: hypothetical protein CK424_07155 [Legionella sp.]